MRRSISVDTSSKIEVIDITSRVDNEVSRADFTNGLVFVSTLHTTCAVILNESDPDLIEDLQNYARDLATSGQFKHRHGPDPKHAASHILSSLFNQSQSIPVSEGQLLLGTWQRVSLFEFEGPREREVQLTFLKTNAND